AVLLPPAAQPATVVEIIVNSPVHETLESAVIAAELADDLSGAGPFTVFAPTDDAFAALPAGTVETLLQDPTGELANILLYHVVGATALSTDLSDGQMIATLLGPDVTVTITGSGVMINNAMVTIADLTADNGVVHVIDAVLLPPASQPATVYEIISNSPDHTILTTALNLTNLDDALNGAGPYTVFAPTDAAFGLLPEGTLDALIAQPTLLTDILLYHVVGATALSTDLSDGQEINTLQGDPVTVTINGTAVQINDANVTVADLTADNGVVHVIDMVLLPPTSVVENPAVDVQVYPNPTTDMVTITGDIAAGSLIRMFGMNGQLMMETSYTGNIQVNVTAFPAGAYQLVVYNGGNVIVKSIVKR
ncbi:MAG: hypothetical protein RL226_271, partial [Bacteroidota bacterium]